MADSASESDSSSIDGVPIMMPPSPVSREQMHKRIESLQQQNRVLKVELETYKLRVKSLQEENRSLRQASVNIQARAEQEEEFISNTLLKKIQALKKEKETLALNYEQEEECLTNDLSRKLNQLRQEKVQLEQTLEQEQECLVNKLMRKIEKLEAETLAKQTTLEQLRREKVELENTLEQEQEALVNKLWKRMDKLEAEKRMLQIKLDQPVSAPPSPRDASNVSNQNPEQITSHIQGLRGEVSRLRHQLTRAQQEHISRMSHYVSEEKSIREENLRLQRRLQLEIDRREALCRHLSESESSLEMEEERHYNEMTSHGPLAVAVGTTTRSRTTSSPVPYVSGVNPSPSTSRPLSPGLFGRESGSRDAFSPPSPMGRCPTCGQTLCQASSSPPHSGILTSGMQRSHNRSSQERFVKPAVPAPTSATSSSPCPAQTTTALSQHVVPNTSAPSRGSGTTSPMDTSRS
nr:EOG090X09V8 [Triops cancriformis]